MRKQQQALIVSIGLVILLIGLAAGMTWANYRYAQSSPGGNDFLVYWMTSRNIFEEGLSPYSEESRVRVQEYAYGRPAEAGEHEMGMAYPLYSVALFAPFTLAKDFDLARALWMTVLEAALIGLALLSPRIMRWKPAPWMMALLIIFSLLWYFGLRALINGNAVILVALCLAGGLLAMRGGHDELAGVLFAFSTIKPQVVVVVLAWIVIWGFTQRRWRMVGWLVGTVALLSGSAMLIMPDWILQNLGEVLRYPEYNPPGNPAAVFAEWWPNFGERLGWALSAVVGLVLLGEWWTNRKRDMRAFLWVTALTLVISPWIGIQTDPGNLIVLFVPLVVVFALLAERSPRGVAVILPIVLLILMVGLWVIFLNTIEYNGQPEQSSILFFPLPTFLLILLYWVRYWAVKPLKFWSEQVDI